MRSINNATPRNKELEKGSALSRGFPRKNRLKKCRFRILNSKY
jgi:hypothetical protein